MFPLHLQALILVASLMAIIYFMPALQNKSVFKSKINLVQVLHLFFFSIFLLVIYSFMIGNLITQPKVGRLPVSDLSFLMMSHTVIALVFLSFGLHKVSKILSDSLEKKIHRFQEAYTVNKFFHENITHLPLYLSLIFIPFLIALIEINHPSALQSLTSLAFFALVGFVLSVLISISITSYSRSTKRNVVILIYSIALSLILLTTVLNLDLNFYNQPYCLGGTVSTLSTPLLLFLGMIFKKMRRNRI